MAREPGDGSGDDDPDGGRTDDVTDEQRPEDATGDEQRPEDATGDEQRPDDAVADADRRPDDMTMAELRAEIESIDREIVDLVARRTYVAETIAQVKAEEGLSTVDEAQEADVMERASENAEAFGVDSNLVKAIFRLLIELNKIEQREQR